MLEFIKQEKKELRNLSAKAYEVELALELTNLQQYFTEWRSGKMSVFELDEKIHNYHSGAHKSLFVLYNQNSNHVPLVARAIALGHISPSQISENIFNKLESEISFFRKNIEPYAMDGENHE